MRIIMVSSRWKGDFAVSIYTEFLVGHIKEDAILGMSFFMKEECTIHFNPLHFKLANTDFSAQIVKDMSYLAGYNPYKLSLFPLNQK